MPIIVNISEDSKKEYEVLSEGVHDGVLADIVDEGLKETAFGQRRRFLFVWLTDEVDTEGRTKYARLYVKTKPITDGSVNLHEKSTMRKQIKAIRSGVDIESGFVLESLIGTQNRLMIQHSEDKEGTVWANISGILKPNPKAKVAIPGDFVRRKDKPQDGKFGGTAQARAILAPAKASPITDSDIPF